MKQLFYPALRHVAYARLIIGVCHVIIFVLGIGMAFFLFPEDAGYSSSFMPAPLVLTIAGFALYPRGAAAENYYRRKLLDLALYSATLLLMMGSTMSLTGSATQCFGLTKQPAASLARESSGSISRQAGRSEFIIRLSRLRHSFQQRGDGKSAGLIALTIFVTAMIILIWAALCYVVRCRSLRASGKYLMRCRYRRGRLRLCARHSGHQEGATTQIFRLTT